MLRRFIVLGLVVLIVLASCGAEPAPTTGSGGNIQTESTKAPAEESTDVPAPEIQPIKIVASGMGYNEDVGAIEVGFIVENPNDQGLVKVVLRVELYSSAGVLLSNRETYPGYLAPKGRFGSSMYFSSTDTGDAKPDRVAVVVESPGKPGEDPYAGGAVTFEGITVENDEAKGVLVNGYAKGLYELGVRGVAFDASGAIVGAGYVNVGTVPAGAKAQVIISMTLSAPAAKVEFYPEFYSGKPFVE